MQQEQLDHLIYWLKESEKNISFGEIKITLIRHAGKTVRIEKTLTERQQLWDYCDSQN